MGHRRQEEVEDPLIPRNRPEQPQRGSKRREPHQQGSEDQIVELRKATSPPEPEAEEKRAIENIEQLDPDRVPPLLGKEYALHDERADPGMDGLPGRLHQRLVGIEPDERTDLAQGQEERQGEAQGEQPPPSRGMHERLESKPLRDARRTVN